MTLQLLPSGVRCMLGNHHEEWFISCHVITWYFVMSLFIAPYLCVAFNLSFACCYSHWLHAMCAHILVSCSFCTAFYYDDGEVLYHTRNRGRNRRVFFHHAMPRRFGADSDQVRQCLSPAHIVCRRCVYMWACIHALLHLVDLAEFTNQSSFNSPFSLQKFSSFCHNILSFHECPHNMSWNVF